MKRLVLTLSAALYLFSHSGFAQEEYEDLLNLYIDEKYEKLRNKAYAYTQNDNHKKNPIPYIYCSMGYYEMSKDIKYKEIYPRAQQDALKYAAKFRKKDKNLEYYDEHLDYLSELRETVIEDAENMLDADKTIKKSHKIYRYLTDIDPNDCAAWLMRGYCELKLRMVTEAEKSFKIAMPLVNNIKKLDDLENEQQYLLKFGIIRYTDYLIEQGMKDSAKVTIDAAYKLFENDEEYKEKFDEVKSL